MTSTEIKSKFRHSQRADSRGVLILFSSFSSSAKGARTTVVSDEAVVDAEAALEEVPLVSGIISKVKLGT